MIEYKCGRHIRSQSQKSQKNTIIQNLKLTPFPFCLSMLAIGRCSNAKMLRTTQVTNCKIFYILTQPLVHMHHNWHS